MTPIENSEFGPSVEELAAIENEWPVLAAELAVVHAECQHLLRPSDITHRSLRRAHRALTTAELHAHNRSINHSPTRGVN